MNTTVRFLHILFVCMCVSAVQARIWAWMLSMPYSPPEEGPMGLRERQTETSPNSQKGDTVSRCFLRVLKIVANLYSSLSCTNPSKIHFENMKTEISTNDKN